MEARMMMTNGGLGDSTGGRLVSVDGRTLPLRGVTLRADARAGLARVVLEQRFTNAHAEPLSVTYLLPLPADGAVSAFAFRIGERRIVGEVDRRAAARERFEEAVASGRTAALVEEERSSLFTQEIGNIPPGAEVVAEITIDQKLVWLAEGAWEWRFPTVVMPRYQGAAGRVADTARVSVDVAEGAVGARATLSLTVRDRIVAGRQAESPSHALTTERDGEIVLTADGGARLDRDVVVRWPVAAARPGLTIDCGRPTDGKPHAGHAYGVVTLVPPSREAPTRAVPRDLCVLIDTSGSMGGEPLDQARRVLGAILDTLGDDDSLEMIEFSNRPRRWKKEPMRTTAGVLEDARAWIGGLRASGSTEMREAIYEALRPLRADTQRQLVLVSDGAIGFENEIVAEILEKLPAASRVHTVGVGSGVNRSLTQPAARAGRGVEIIIGLGEDPERAARRLVAHTTAPLVVELSLSGSALVEHAPLRLPDLFAGAPALCAVKLAPEGGELVARGRTATGAWEERIQVAPLAAGAGSGAVVALFGREQVEDLETRLCAGEPADELNGAIEKLGVEFQIATRLTSWVAIAETPSVDPTAPTRREKMPHELPYGVSAEGLGLRATWSGGPPLWATGGGAASGAFRAMSIGSALLPPSVSASASAPRGPDMKRRGAGGVMKAIGEIFSRDRSAAADEEGESGIVLPAPKGAAAATLRGVVKRWKDGDLIVEIELAEELDWRAEGEALVTFADGTERPAAIEAGATTRAGRIAGGRTVRLTLRFAAESAGQPRRISFGGIVIEV
ncbi:MAG: hypothetical protein JWN44_2201 [Myxococcales bacterium]|nr:hypothetical protein [Myxococcales bacterium]